MMTNVEDLLLGDVVRSPGGQKRDRVVRLHLRREAADTQTVTGVTVTHEDGCWTLPLRSQVYVERRVVQP